MSELTQIGRYIIKTEIGRGGMATVYLAHDPHFERDVAIKVLPMEFLHDPSFLKRFSQEARTIARLEHQRILPVYDFGEADGTPFIVMRYMPRQSLRHRLSEIEGTGLPVNEVVRIFDQVGEALDFAHKNNVIHRDLKPGNVLLDEVGNTYLSDFGIAKVIESSMSYSGTLWVGTPSYMAPEQVRGGKPNPSTDIYAMGAMLFELLTGRVPFQAVDPLALAYLHVNEKVPLMNDIRPDLLPGLQSVVEKAMAKETEERYPTCSSLAEALAEVAEGKQVPEAREKGTGSGSITPESASAEPYQTMDRVALSASERAGEEPGAGHTPQAEEEPVIVKAPDAVGQVYQTQVPQPEKSVQEKEPEDKQVPEKPQRKLKKEKPAPNPKPRKESQPKPIRPKPEIHIPWKWVGPALGGLIMILFLVLVYFSLIPFPGLQQLMMLYLPDSEAPSILSRDICGSNFDSDIYVNSRWSENLTRMDGKPSSVYEWDDAACTQVTFFEPDYSGGGLEYSNPIRAKFWIKNDEKWIYLLVQVKKSYGEVGGMFFDHWWLYWDKSDGVSVSAEGKVSDLYGWDETQWYADQDGGGKMNAVGAASQDETYYWFEVKKELDSGDGLDWSWRPGGSSGATNSTLLGVWGLTDNIAGHQLNMILSLAHE